MDSAYKNEKRFAVLLSIESNVSNFWDNDKYIGCTIYDLNENNVEIIHIVDGNLVSNLRKCIIVNTITDQNWTNGISNKDAIVLIKNNKFNNENIKDAKALKSNQIIKNIKNIQISEQWIYVELSDRDEIEQFASPNVVEVVK